jgi:hypothetical protein
MKGNEREKESQATVGTSRMASKMSGGAVKVDCGQRVLGKKLTGL